MKKTSLLFFIQIAIAGAALFFVARRFGGSAVFIDGLRGVAISWVVLCLFVALIAHGIGVWRWRMLANAALSSPRPFLFYLRYYLIGLFYGTFMPGGQLVGEGMKIARMMPDQQSRSAFIASIVADRLTGLAANGVLLAVFFLDSFYIRSSPLSGWGFGVGMAVIAGSATLYAALFWSGSSEQSAAPPLRRGAGMYGAVFLRKIRESADAFLQKKTALAASFAGGLAFHIAAGLLLYLAIRAYGARPDFFFVVWVYLLASIALVLPISYAGFGIREGVLVYLFAFAGIVPEKVILISFLFFAVQAVFALAGGLFEIKEVRSGFRR